MARNPKNGTWMVQMIFRISIWVICRIQPLIFPGLKTCRALNWWKNLRNDEIYTCLKLSSPLKIGGWEMKFPFGAKGLFSGAMLVLGCFREGKPGPDKSWQVKAMC